MTTETEPGLIVQLPRGGAVDRNWREDMPPSVASNEVIVERLPAGADGRLEPPDAVDPPDADEIVMTVLSPEALKAEPDEVAAGVAGAAPGEQALVIIVEAAEYLREDELAVVLDAAKRAHRLIILRVMADA